MMATVGNAEWEKLTFAGMLIMITSMIITRWIMTSIKGLVNAVMIKGLITVCLLADAGIALHKRPWT